MSNSYFQFKQFIVHQDLCAMKVCTDACLFGAWISSLQETRAAKRCLDIGAGTGLLSLMLAQKSEAIINAVEIDDNAAHQAEKNFTSGPWKERLQVTNASIDDYNPGFTYDFIFSNPPFFEGSLKSDNSSRNVALHSTELSSSALVDKVKRLLSPGGCFAVLIPHHLIPVYEKLANNRQLYLWRHANVRQTERHAFFRSMMLFGSEHRTLKQEEIRIKTEGNYSPEFVQLLREYYLYL